MPTRGSEAMRAETRNQRLFVWPYVLPDNYAVMCKLSYDHAKLV